MTDATLAILALIAAALALVGTMTTAILSRRSAREATTLTSWKELASEQRAELDRRDAAHKRDMDEIRARVSTLETDVAHEKRERQSLATVLRSAWSHILRLGEQIRGLGGHPAPPPPDLSAWMQQDGLVVDRVETTITRTMVTDTRTPDEPPLEINESHGDGGD